MKNGKYCNGKKSLNMKPLAILLALTLLVGCAIGGTIAWLTAETDEVANTFTVGDINIELKEHKLLENGTLGTDEVTQNTGYKFVPGDTLPKDPFVRVKANSEDCYVFIKVQETNNSRMDLNGKIINWAVREGWTAYAANPAAVSTTYYYRTVNMTDTDQVFYILTGGEEANENGQVTVNAQVTKDMVTSLTNSKPMLKIDAAAVQTANIDGVDAAFAQIVWAD